jgi:crotonobetainyl-CoA:carnitine CoA-transferase CaiB-like acyl-CoA transferase
MPAGDGEDATPGRGALDGTVVVDLSRALAGPHAAMMLGDLGARVIKVEAPGTGDDSRSWGPPFVGDPAAPEATYFLCCNRNKESVTADLKSEDGRWLLQELVRHADVLVENFRPGVMDRLGFGTDTLHELNPGLVVLSISGFGHDGPQGGRAGYDQIVQGEAGLMSITGTDAGTPTRVGVPISDLLAGVHGAYGVLAALVERERTGRGQVVRTSLLAATVGAHTFQGTRYTVAGEVPGPNGNHHGAIAPYGLFRCRDGALQVAVATQGQWRRFADVLDLDADDPRFDTNAHRVAHRDELTAEIENRLSAAPAAHWLMRIDEVGIPCGEVRSIKQVYDDPQTESQGLIIDVDHAALGPIRIPGPAVRFDRAGRQDHQAPPTLGQHDATVRQWLAEASARGRVGRRDRKS